MSFFYGFRTIAFLGFESGVFKGRCFQWLRIGFSGSDLDRVFQVRIWIGFFRVRILLFFSGSGSGSVFRIKNSLGFSGLGFSG